MDGVILKDIKVNGNHIDYNFEVTGVLKSYFSTDTMFIEYQEDMSMVPESILAAPFVASIIPLMWATNTVMWVKEIDKTFYDSILRVHDAYQRLYSHFPLKGNLIPANFIDNQLQVIVVQWRFGCELYLCTHPRHKASSLQHTRMV